jgi:two-component system OmpR family sensor kinase
MNRVSLRTRLVAVAVTLVAVAVVATAIATYAALHTYLFGRLDDQVAELAAHSGPALCAPRSGPGGGLSSEQAPYAAAVTATGRVGSVACDEAGYRLARQLPLTATDGRELTGLTGATAPRTVSGTDGVRYRVIGLPYQGADSTESQGDRVVTLVVGLSAGEVEGTLGRLLGLELVIGAAAVVGTGVLGAAGVRLGMRPLDRVTRTARTVAAELGPDGSGLDRRVPEADPHTEVGQLAEAVNTMLDAVEREYSARYESEQRMRRFLADASHELRTPLTSLRGYAELVRLRGGLDEAAGDSLRRIESEGTRMGRLVDDLLTLARADRGTIAERAPVDVAAVVSDSVAGLRAAHPDRPVSVRAGGPLPVLGDRDQLVQVVGNVLTNAAVHAHGTIAVSASRQDGEVVVQVVDGGPGLPPEQAAQVFDRFWRADAARTRVRGGSGLGLSIVQVLVTDHGGRVSFDSDPDAGTTVTVRLPAAPAP